MEEWAEQVRGARRPGGRLEAGLILGTRARQRSTSRHGVLRPRRDSDGPWRRETWRAPPLDDQLPAVCRLPAVPGSLPPVACYNPAPGRGPSRPLSTRTTVRPPRRRLDTRNGVIDVAPSRLASSPERARRPRTPLYLVEESEQTSPEIRPAHPVRARVKQSRRRRGTDYRQGPARKEPSPGQRTFPSRALLS